MMRRERFHPPIVIAVAMLASGCFSDPGRGQPTDSQTSDGESTTLGSTENPTEDPTENPTTTTSDPTGDPTGDPDPTQTDTSDTTEEPECLDPDDCDEDGISNAEEMVDGSDCRRSDPYRQDTDNDGLLDAEDPYPRDPYPRFVLFRNETGTIDFMLANGDGKYQPPIQIGSPYGGSEIATYRYTFCAISDFDDNGQLDFLAIGDPDPEAAGERELWWFERTGIDTFTQRKIDPAFSGILSSTIIDLDGDGYPETVTLEKDQPNYIESGWIYTNHNTGNVATATCGATEETANPDDCLFVRTLAADVSAWVNDQWSLAFTRYGFDGNGDGIADLLISRSSNGGNANSPIAMVPGVGDGSFLPPGPTAVVHNNDQMASPARAIGTGDFNNDGHADIFAGLDQDDGVSGSLWLYLGEPHPDGGTLWAADNGSEVLNIGSASTTVIAVDDYNNDGDLDLMLGFTADGSSNPPSQTELFTGNGDGTFNLGEIVREFPDSTLGTRFFAPQDGCVPTL